MSKRNGNKNLPVRANISLGGRRQYAHEFIEVVVAHAFKHDAEEAAAYYDISINTVRRWMRRYKELAAEVHKMKVASTNPYRGTEYGIVRRINLSDKLFAEVEHTLEVTKVKHGYVPADQLVRLITAYGLLTDKRRLEEGAHTALIQAIKDPEAIVREGEAKVVEFSKRAALPPGG